MTTKGQEITVGQLKSQLEAFRDDDVLEFGGLDFYRLKRRGAQIVQVEFNQQVYIDENDQVQVDNI